LTREIFKKNKGSCPGEIKGFPAGKKTRVRVATERGQKKEEEKSKKKKREGKKREDAP